MIRPSKEWMRAYRRRWYVVGMACSWGLALAGLGLAALAWAGGRDWRIPLLLCLVAWFVGAVCGVAHVVDSRRRIRWLEERLRRAADGRDDATRR
jgi:hypothetical protein